MYECFAYMYVCVLHSCLLPAKARGGHLIIGTEVTNGDELCGHWKLNLGPPEEQSLNHQAIPLALKFVFLHKGILTISPSFTPFGD